jgi:type VI secretion system protein ImpG
MADELLGYYNRELTFIRHFAAKFAEDHPKIAERLRLNPDDAADDPHVERLIEAFAYLTARIRYKLDDDFPELTASLMDMLYPHYQAPIPSMAIVKFVLDPEQVQLTGGYTIPRHADLETEPIDGEPCRFRTCYPVTLWPIDVQSAIMAPAPLPAPVTPYSDEAMAVIRIALTCLVPESSFADLELSTLRFFLRGQPHNIYRLYELLFNNAVGMAVTRSAGPVDAVLLGSEALRQVGFERDEGLLPYPARSFLGYRLITEYFAFPQKFLFLDLDLSGIKSLQEPGRQIVLYIYLSRMIPELARTITADTFQLGCTPMVNLYAQRAEPIHLSHREFEYQVVPDRRHPQAHEVYSIDRVLATAPEGSSVEFIPFFSTKHAHERPGEQPFWHASRWPSEGINRGADRGTEVYLSLVDLEFRPSAPADWTLDVETTCLNRDLPQGLPFGGDQPRLQLREGSGVISGIVSLTTPTRTLRPPLRQGLLWPLISHLSLNHLSLCGDGHADAFREILKLYDFANSADTRSQLSGIVGLEGRRIVGSVRSDGMVALCRGLEVKLRFDEERFSAGSLFLFASVLERFLALYCTVNSFSKLIATVKGRQEELRRWPPRMGERVLA